LVTQPTSVPTNLHNPVNVILLQNVLSTIEQIYIAYMKPRVCCRQQITLEIVLGMGGLLFVGLYAYMLMIFLCETWVVHWNWKKGFQEKGFFDVCEFLAKVNSLYTCIYGKN